MIHSLDVQAHIEGCEWIPNWAIEKHYLGNTTVCKVMPRYQVAADNYMALLVITLPRREHCYNKTDASQIIVYIPVETLLCLVDIVFHAEFLTMGKVSCFRDNILMQNCNELTGECKREWVGISYIFGRFGA